MPFKSKKQWKKFFAMANRGEMPESKAREWARETKTPYKKLPEKKKEKRTKEAMLLKMAADLGRLHAYNEAGLDKEAAGKLLPIGVGLGVGALAGAIATKALSAKEKTQDIADQLRGRMASLPNPVLAELMMQGMSPAMASHVLSLRSQGTQ
jgi:hypothetical protein